MKKIWSFMILSFSFCALFSLFFNAEAGVNPNFDIIDTTEPESPALIYTGIKATLHDKRGWEIKNGVSDEWDLYVNPNKDYIVQFSDVSNLYLVSYKGEIYPIAGYAEFLNGIVRFDSPKFRILESEKNFYTGKLSNVATRKDYDVFQLPGHFTAFYYKDGTKDVNFELTKAFTSDPFDPTFLVLKRESKIMRYYKFKSSEMGENEKIKEGNILNLSGLSSAIIKTNFNSISELNRTLDSSYYYISFVLFLY